MTPHTLTARLTYARHSVADGFTPDVALLDLSSTIKGHKTMTQHTPGPWTTSYSQTHMNVFFRDLFGHDASIATVIGNGDKSIANARLIAAAPDLLAALQFVDKWIAMRASKGDAAPSQLANSVAAAIAKATGTNPATIR